MLVDHANLGFGLRCWRDAMPMNDGGIATVFSESDDGDNGPLSPFGASDADTMVATRKDSEPGGVSWPGRTFEG